MQVSVEGLDRLVLLINKRASERDRRILLSAAAEAYGHGGKGRVRELTGIAYSTLSRGSRDAEAELSEGSGAATPPQAKEAASERKSQGEAVGSPAAGPPARRHTGSALKDPTRTMDGRERQRRPGAGRPSVLDAYPDLPDHIDQLINWRAPTFGSPMGGPIRVDRAMSERRISEELRDRWGEEVSDSTLHGLLPRLGYSKMASRKEKQVGRESPWRNEQFLHIAATTQEFVDAGDPVISIDTKKKEKVGLFRNDGREWCLKGLPREVPGHDFLIRELGQVAPYGVYVLNDNTGFVNLGIDHDTSEFAVESVRRWWLTLGQASFPDAGRVYVNCDGGGSNGTTRRAWKAGLQRLADETGLEIVVSHYPPGTSKWNKIEHRMFSFISMNWQGKPLVSVEAIVDLIESTTTKGGLTIRCQLDTNPYQTGEIVTDGMMERLSIERRPPEEGEDPECSKQMAAWNYTIRPRSEEDQRAAAEADAREIEAEEAKRARQKARKEAKRKVSS